MPGPQNPRVGDRPLDWPCRIAYIVAVTIFFALLAYGASR